MHMECLVNIYAIIKCRYSYIKLLREIINEHSHDFFQLVYVLSGNGFISTDDRVTKINKNDVLIINPGIKHLLFCKDGVMTTYELKFYMPDSNLSNLLTGLPMFISDSDGKILSVFKRINNESKEKNQYWLEILQHSIIELIYIINRCLPNGFKHEHNENSSDNITVDENNKIFMAARYIEKNYNSHITLKKLADLLALSESHFSREFVKYFSKSPIRYLNDIRIEIAKELLKNSDYSITEISAMTGFSSVHYFSRYFAKKESCSPNKYRALLRDEYTIFL